ncbi:MAG: hypothetical protein C0467_19545 [Planctomycetaceae bacterium]|nr:hypothetical protein [Planctomycetaceae bacterium]
MRVLRLRGPRVGRRIRFREREVRHDTDERPHRRASHEAFHANLPLFGRNHSQPHEWIKGKVFSSIPGEGGTPFPESFFSPESTTLDRKNVYQNISHRVFLKHIPSRENELWRWDANLYEHRCTLLPSGINTALSGIKYAGRNGPSRSRLRLQAASRTALPLTRAMGYYPADVFGRKGVRMRNRTRDYIILLAVAAILTLPNLGAVSLWDMDEGVNAQAAREMREADTWVIPTFNYQLRTAKPVMLYWLQRASYAAFGVNEWSARLPSVLASWLIVLMIYELARQMFGRSTGLLAGVVLASVSHFSFLAHAATPDATLLMYTCLTYLAFWTFHRNNSRAWWVPTAAACGLAMLTKGPVGVALPGVVFFLYFAWNRELGRLLDRRFFLASVVFIFVAIPWYALVASETRGEWLAAFFGNENVNRFLSPMEGHRGGPWFYPVAIFVLFAPWTAFLIGAVWYGAKATRSTQTGEGEMGRGGDTETNSEGVRPYRFLVCWAVAYLVFFSAAATKLPNYVFPVYPALAILTARFIIRWRDGELTVPQWMMPAAAAGLVVNGLIVVGGMLFAERLFPGLGIWALLGLAPAAGGIAMAWYLRKGDRNAAVVAVSVAAIAFVSVLVAWVPGVVERQRAPRDLVRATGLSDPTREFRIASYAWFEPSVVFYTGREVGRLDSPSAVRDFLAIPTPGYLFVAGNVWDEIATATPGPYRVLARKYDFLKRCEVVVVTNTPSADVAVK